MKGVHRALKEELVRRLAVLIDEASFVGGEEVEAFCREFGGLLGVRYVVPCNSGTDALEGALRVVGRRGSGGGSGGVPVAVTTPFTFVATAEAILHAGYQLRFVDVEEDTYLMDLDQVESLLWSSAGGDVRVVVPVHLFGQGVDMDRLVGMCRRRSVAVVEDCAQAVLARVRVGGKWRYVGTCGDAGCFSFYPTKNLGACGDGGAVVTGDEGVAQGVRRYFSHGEDRRYYSVEVGRNSRLDAFQAAVLRVKLAYLARWTEFRRRVARWYEERLRDVGEVRLPVVGAHSTHVYHLYVIRVGEGQRDGLRAFLWERGIQTGVYYPVALHRMPAYSFLGYKEGSFPVAERLVKEVLALPMHPYLTEEDVDWVCRWIRRYFGYGG